MGEIGLECFHKCFGIVGLERMSGGVGAAIGPARIESAAGLLTAIASLS